MSTTVQGLLDGQFTLGIEEEFQIVHPETRELRSYVSQLLEGGKHSILRERVRPEMHQSVVETGTGICRDIRQARQEICELRGELSALAGKHGLRIVAAGTHPFSDWKKQEITDGERYKVIVEDLQDVARANLIFGLHVHVGIKDKEVAMALANQVRYFLPHLLALSTSSPFWLGRATGLKSIRSEIFKRFPRTGIPGHFDSYAQFQSYVDLLVKTGCIDNAKKIWWDVRAHPFFDTVEVRICDMTTRIDDTVALTALIQALMGKLYLLYRKNMGFREYARELIEENKWRALRYGIDGQLIDFGKQEQLPVRVLIGELLDFVEEAAAIFKSEADLDRIRGILREGTSADKQLAVFQKTQSVQAIVDHLIEQTAMGA
ncbi:carboxylate-amine ligase [Polyangium jinanense]|uniref:Putative glutamate--cysteine ligase 2 n=1 Tax=Polyangium jinanense TaxID=2829994 RepID=A0A9X3X3C8_9BACT|nr:carboxylate-amine ligase [Polyangium jinanense]MDC3957934.1 carboxylate-amine ligase [Polyangium jinanense]MDC3983487.1 carboxylate-amine ligase [Polyangium jinanense]